MPRRRTTDPASRSAALPWLTGIGVAVIAVLVGLLVVLALQHARGDAAAPTSTRPLPAYDAETPTPTPTAVAVPPPGAEERFLAVGDGVLWRATAGACGGPAPVIERSTDDGATWQDVTPTYRGIAQVLTLDPFAGDQAEVVALVGAGCEVQALRTFTSGRFWEPYAEVLAASTYLDPVNAGMLVRPAGAVATPCEEPWGLRARAGTVALVCEGVAYRLDPSGWVALSGADAVAVAVAPDAVSVVTAGAAEAPAAAWPEDDGLLVWTGAQLRTIAP